VVQNNKTAVYRILSLFKLGNREVDVHNNLRQVRRLGTGALRFLFLGRRGPPEERCMGSQHPHPGTRGQWSWAW